MRCQVAVWWLSWAWLAMSGVAQENPDSPPSSVERPRLRDLGLVVGRFPPGAVNAITDVPGVLVGHSTVREDGALATGVTAIRPHAGDLFNDKVRAGVFVGNGFGKLVGTTQIVELGQLETPILLTGTLSTFRVADHLISWVLAQPGHERVRSVNPVVGETNDGSLSDIRRRPITREHVFAALDQATTGAVPEGSVGAGTGTRCLGVKGGIGTSSRRVASEDDTWTVGALVQTNFGGTLTVCGVSMGDVADASGRAARDGSCMIVVATDAPLDARQLTRLARRAVFALARTGARYSHGSGDYALTLSTERVASPRRVDDARLSGLFEACLEAVEEAVLNSMLRATPVTGFEGRTVPVLDVDAVVRKARARGLPARAPGVESKR